MGVDSPISHPHAGGGTFRTLFGVSSRVTLLRVHCLHESPVNLRDCHIRLRRIRNGESAGQVKRQRNLPICRRAEANSVNPASHYYRRDARLSPPLLRILRPDYIGTQNDSTNTACRPEFALGE